MALWKFTRKGAGKPRLSPRRSSRAGRGPADQLTAALGTRPARGQRTWEARRSAGVSPGRFDRSSPVCPRRGASSFPVPASCPHGVCFQEAAARAALSLRPARRDRRTWRRGARTCAQLRKRRARRPRPSQVLRRRASSASSRPAGAGRGAWRGGSGAQRSGQPSRPPGFHSIVGWLTQSAATWPRLAPSPPGAPRPRGSRRGWTSCEDATRSPKRRGHDPPGTEMPVTLPWLRTAGQLVGRYALMGGLSSGRNLTTTGYSYYSTKYFPGCLSVSQI